MSGWGVFTAGRFLTLGEHTSPNKAMEPVAKRTRGSSP